MSIIFEPIHEYVAVEDVQMSCSDDDKDEDVGNEDVAINDDMDESIDFDEDSDRDSEISFKEQVETEYFTLLQEVEQFVGDNINLAISHSMAILPFMLWVA